MYTRRPYRQSKPRPYRHPRQDRYMRKCHDCGQERVLDSNGLCHECDVRAREAGTVTAPRNLHA